MAFTKTDTTVTNIPDISKSIRDDLSADGTRLYIDTQLAGKSDVSHTHSAYAPIDNPAFTGAPTAPSPSSGNNSTRVATTAYVRSYASATYLPLDGGSLTNFLTLHADPTSNMHAATKRYVDNVLTSMTTLTYTSADVAVNVAATTASVSHTLGVVPTYVSVFLKCVVAERGYSVGDIIDLKMPAGTQIYNIWGNSSQLGISSVNNFSVIFTYLVAKSGTSYGSFDSTKWRFVFKAIA